MTLSGFLCEATYRETWRKGRSLPSEAGKPEEEVMRRLLYLVALSLATMLLFVPTAWAQSGASGAQEGSLSL